MSRPIPVVFVATLALAVGCAHAQKAAEPVVERSVTPPAPKAAPQLVTHAAPAPTPVADASSAQGDLDAALAELAKTKLFFSTDDATLTSEAEQKLATVGRILAAHPKLAVTVEGNCDERGTEDYNLVLGQKRAEAARQYLVAMGAGEGQVKTVSYGSERPAVPGHDERAWSQNRRDDLVVAGARE